MNKRGAMVLVIAAAAILALVASYAIGSVSGLGTVTVSEKAAAPAGPASSALAIPVASGTHSAPSASAREGAQFGPRLTTDVPRMTGSSHTMNPGCSGDCPMGLTDYGLTSSLSAYKYAYTFSESYWDSGTTFGIGVANGGGCLDPDAEAGLCFTIQQNTIVQDIYHGSKSNSGYYWTQNVPEVAYDESCSSPCVSGTYSVTFIDNIWNFSDSKGICPSDTDTGAGCINPNTIVGDQLDACTGGYGGAPTYYYCVSSTLYDVLPPFTITAATNVNYFGCATGANCVYFYGSVEEVSTVLFGGYYDEVEFHSVDGSKAPFYEVQDKNTPFGLPEDYEWVFGGPGGGSGNAIADYGDLQSFYCDKTCGTQSNWHSIQNAWSSGYDTAEYIYDVYVIPEFNYRDAAELSYAADDAQTWIF